MMKMHVTQALKVTVNILQMVHVTVMVMCKSVLEFVVVLQM